MTNPTNDLTLHVKTTADGKGLRQAADDLDKTTKATEKTKKATDKLGDSFHETTRDLKDYSEQLRKLYAEREHLARSYQESGDRELLAEFNRTNRQIGLIEKLRKVVTKGPDVGQALRGLDLPSKIGGFGPYAIGAMGAVGAAAAPPLGAMLGGAFSGTVVGAAMAGGILAASQDSSVTAAARDFGDTISREFFASGDAFVTPIRNSLNILEADFQDLELESVFAKAAPQVERVAHGIGDMAKNFVSGGLDKVLDRSAGYSKEFADGLGELGSALGKMVDDMSSSEGAVEGLNALFKVIGGTAVAIGMTVNVLADTFDVLTDAVASVTGVLEDIPAPLQVAFFGHAGFGEANDIFEDINKSGFEAADGIGAAGRAAGDTAAEADALAAALYDANKAFENYFDMGMNVDVAALNVQKGMIELQKTLRENGPHWETNTEKGLENRQMLLYQVQALNDKREAEIAASDGSKASVDKINAAYDKAVAKLKVMATNAGITELAFMDLAGSYTVTFHLNQVAGRQVMAWSELRNAERQLAENNSGPGIKRQFIQSFASGGDTPAFQPFYTHPGETMWSDKAHYVATKAQTAALVRGGTASGGGTVRHVIDLRLNGRTQREIAIDDALGRGVSEDLVLAAYP